MPSFRKRSRALFVLLAAAACLARPAAALEADAARGNSFSCFIWVPYEIVNTNVTFSQEGTVEFAAWSGNGFYTSATSFFSGFYWAVDAITVTDDEDAPGPSDMNLVFSGTTAGPFIVGAGIIVLDYGEVYPLVFVGILNTGEESAQ